MRWPPRVCSCCYLLVSLVLSFLSLLCCFVPPLLCCVISPLFLLANCCC